jgi:hypothetical protein
MDHRAEAWYRRRTSHWRDWPLGQLLEDKQRHGARISVMQFDREDGQVRRRTRQVPTDERPPARTVPAGTVLATGAAGWPPMLNAAP